MGRCRLGGSLTRPRERIARPAEVLDQANRAVGPIGALLVRPDHHESEARFTPLGAR
jgi:hypothetical protein